MIFKEKLAILLTYFSFFNNNTADNKLAHIIASVVDKPECYKSKSNLDKCIIKLGNKKQYETRDSLHYTKSNEVKRFAKQYNQNYQTLLNSKIIGNIYPEKKQYDTLTLIYDESQGIEVFRTKLQFVNQLYNKGYKWSNIYILVSSKLKQYSIDMYLILQNKITTLNMKPVKIIQNSKAIDITNDLDIVQILLKQVPLNPQMHKMITIYSKDKTITKIMRDWVFDHKSETILDVQVNPSIQYYKSKWNKYLNYSSKKIEVVGDAGVTYRNGQVDIYQNTPLILNNIALYYANLKKYNN